MCALELTSSQLNLQHGTKQKRVMKKLKINKNSSRDEIAKVNFYAVRPEATRIR